MGVEATGSRGCRARGSPRWSWATVSAERTAGRPARSSLGFLKEWGGEDATQNKGIAA